jgi:tetratricopeptide (TPR) repeat protein
MFDAAILTQDWGLLAESRNVLTNHRDRLPVRVVDALKRALTPEDDPVQKRRLLAHWERDLSYVRRSVGVYKTRVREYPRDALAHLELARLYTVLAQVDRAEFHLALARQLAPDDRYILRATLRFYDFRGDLAEGLRIIRQSDRLQHDPWIKSAELAASTLLGKASRVSKNPELAYTPDGSIDRAHSELAMALATRELEAGAKERKIFQMVRRALPSSTENGVAQAVWLSDKSSRGFEARFPDNEPGAEANEANVQLAVDRKDFTLASQHAELWLEDQPFSRDALIKYLNLRSVHLQPDKSSIEWAHLALKIHGDDWQVMNAVVLLFSESGHLDLAGKALDNLRRKVPRGNQDEAFLYAAEGFLAFANYDFGPGRTAYLKAVEIARKHRSQALIIDALMFWLRCEAKHHLISKAFYDQIAESFKAAMKKVSNTDRGFLEGIWHSIEQSVSIDDDNEPKEGDSPILETVSLALADMRPETQLVLV